MTVKEIDHKMEEAKQLANKYTWGELYKIKSGKRKR